MTVLHLGARHTIAGVDQGRYELPVDDLVTHGVVVGMTGSGKTGLLTVLAEEALRAGLATLLIDVKGDLPNLKLLFPSSDPSHLAPWVEAARGDADGVADLDQVQAAADQRAFELSRWSISEADLAEVSAGSHVRIITPGSDAGESLNVLSGLERRSPRWDSDVAAARSSLDAAVSLVLQLVTGDEASGESREHGLLAVLAERRFKLGLPTRLEDLIGDLMAPPIESIGALPIDSYVGPARRTSLAADLNKMIASPKKALWRTGQDLDVSKWMAPVDGKTPATIVSVAHLDEAERLVVLGVILEEVLNWVRSLPGTSMLKALVIFDEVYGFLPPHPRSPPTKRPMISLMKQARAYGVGCVVATQNPMDLDYRALSNAGTWMLGRLQTDADRARVVEGLGEDKKKSKLGALLKKMAPRWFVMRSSKGELSILHPRWAMSYLRGPMTPQEIRNLRTKGGAP